MRMHNSRRLTLRHLMTTRWALGGLVLPAVLAGIPALAAGEGRFICALSPANQTVSQGQTARLTFSVPDASACQAGTVSCVRSSLCNTNTQFCNSFNSQWVNLQSPPSGYVDLSATVPNPFGQTYVATFSCSCTRAINPTPISCNRVSADVTPTS
jgi:hypothetical protein